MLALHVAVTCSHDATMLQWHAVMTIAVCQGALPHM